MKVMTEALGIIEAPLSRNELAIRYRQMCEDPCLVNIPGKLELDVWGRILMTPANTRHGVLQGRLAHALKAQIGGEVIVECAIATPAGLFVPDLAWASPTFMDMWGAESPLMRAPEVCVEVISPSNSRQEMAEKRDAYFAVGAQEVWFVYQNSKRWEFYGATGQLPNSGFAVDLSEIFA